MTQTSIIVVVKDCLEYTKKCLDSLAFYTKDFELIIVDNGSNEETKEYLRNLDLFEGYRIVWNKENMGCPYAWDQGIKLATCDFIAIVSNDCVVTPNWLTYLMKCFADNPRCGVASPTTSFCGGRRCDKKIKEARYTMTQQDMNDYAKTLKFGYIDCETFGFAFLTHKKVIEKIGVFDYKRYGLGTWEERDFNWRAKQSGFRTYWVKHAYVHHYGHAIFEKGNISANADELRTKNRLVFLHRVADRSPLFIDNDVIVKTDRTERIA
jgi:GT2 family glycosyltransferase